MPLAARATSWLSRIVKQDGHGVHGQDLLDANQQLVQELLQAEFGERRVAQAVKAPKLVRRRQFGGRRREHDLAGPGGSAMVPVPGVCGDN